MHIIFWLLAVIFLAACAPASINLPYLGHSNTRAPTGTFPEPAQFSYQKLAEDSQVNELPWEETEHYRSFKVRLPHKLPEETQKSFLEFTFYKSKLADKEKLIIVLSTYSQRQFHRFPMLNLGAYLTAWNPYADFNVALLEEQEGDDPFDLDALKDLNSEEDNMRWMRESARRFRKIVVGIRRMLDWAEKESSIDMSRVGIAGFSTSAPIVAVAMGIDPRISAAAIFLGSANFHEVLAQSEEVRMKTWRERSLERSGQSREDFAAHAYSILDPINPLRHSSSIDPGRVLYFDAEFDEFVPRSVREAFWRALGKPERITFLAKHRPSFFSLTPLDNYSSDRKIIDFFRKKL